MTRAPPTAATASRPAHLVPGKSLGGAEAKRLTRPGLPYSPDQRVHDVVMKIDGLIDNDADQGDHYPLAEHGQTPIDERSGREDHSEIEEQISRTPLAELGKESMLSACTVLEPAIVMDPDDHDVLGVVPDVDHQPPLAHVGDELVADEEYADVGEQVEV